MKKETAEAKLNQLFGDMFVKKVEEVKVKTTGRVVGITEEEIQEFREIQGILYFLQAPALFSYKVCGHCGADFFVSRKYVKYCSYTCMKLEFRKQGFEWRKGNDIEALVLDPQVYDGNEPIWIRSRALQSIREMVLSLPENINHGTKSENTSYSELVASDLERLSSRSTETSSTSDSRPTMTTSGSPKRSIKMSGIKPRLT